MARRRKTHADKCRDLIKTVKFPEFNYFDYDRSLGANLTVYYREVDASAKKKSTLLFWDSQGKDISAVSKLKKSWFSTVGAVAHMTLARGIDLHENDRNYLEKKYRELSVLALRYATDSNDETEEEEVEDED